MNNIFISKALMEASEKSDLFERRVRRELMDCTEEIGKKRQLIEEIIKNLPNN